MRLIDADELKKEYFGFIRELDVFQNKGDASKRVAIDKCLSALLCQPTVDPIKHAHWIRNIIDGTYVCSSCEGVEECCTDFCSYCGAKMEDI